MLDTLSKTEKHQRYQKNKMKAQLIVLLSVLITLVTGCNDSVKHLPDKEKLIIYCGITMVRPMKEIISMMEKRYDCQITLIQGGSEDLYQSLKMSRKGDLYFPGSHDYRKKHLDEGLLDDYVEVGYNQAALLVQKGNPYNISSDIKNLLNKKLNVVIGNPETCSIGKQAKKILDKAAIYQEVVDNIVTFAADSRNMNNMLINKTADIIFNWRATAAFSENQELVDVVILDEMIAPKNRLQINLLSFSEHKDLSRKLMEIASAKEGAAIFKKYGFTD